VAAVAGRVCTPAVGLLCGGQPRRGHWPPCPGAWRSTRKRRSTGSSALGRPGGRWRCCIGRRPPAEN